MSWLLRANFYLTLSKRFLNYQCREKNHRVTSQRSVKNNSNTKIQYLSKKIPKQLDIYIEFVGEKKLYDLISLNTLIIAIYFRKKNARLGMMKYIHLEAVCMFYGIENVCLFLQHNENMLYNTCIHPRQYFRGHVTEQQMQILLARESPIFLCVMCKKLSVLRPRIIVSHLFLHRVEHYFITIFSREVFTSGITTINISPQKRAIGYIIIQLPKVSPSVAEIFGNILHAYQSSWQVLQTTDLRWIGRMKLNSFLRAQSLNH